LTNDATNNKARRRRRWGRWEEEEEEEEEKEEERRAQLSYFKAAQAHLLRLIIFGRRGARRRSLRLLIKS